MNLGKPAHLALLLAAIIGLLGTLATGLYVFSEFHLFKPGALALVFLWIGGISYLIVRFGVEQFIYSKVKVIYKNIHELKIGSEEDEEQIARTSDLEVVQREVEEWTEERKREITELRERENYRREFIGNVSHELKTPVFNIQGYLLTLLDGALDDPQINTKYLKRANKSVDRMISILQDLDTISRLESGTLDMKLVDFDIVELVKEVYDMLEDKADKRHVKLKLKKEYDKPIWVHGDPKRVEQVVFNLVVNAIKYSKKDGGQVEVRFFDMHQNILVEVNDDGLGIPEKDVPRIFERFYRVDKSRTRDAGGSGLGLAIVKHIIDAHKQTINVRSAEGVGSTFSFTLKKAR